MITYDNASSMRKVILLEWKFDIQMANTMHIHLKVKDLIV